MRTLGKSQKDLARELQVSCAYISQILTCKRNPPDLGRRKNRIQLRTWAQFLETRESDILELVRHELHRIPLKPDAKFPQMRELLLDRLDPSQESLNAEIQRLELHPAENRAIEAMSQVYLLSVEDCDERRAHSVTRFRELCSQARTEKSFVENTLVAYFINRQFSWSWDFELNSVHLDSESVEIVDAQEQVRSLLFEGPAPSNVGTVPVVGHVSAGEGFEFTDGGFEAGEGFEQVPLPPGVDPGLAGLLYCVRARGNSLKEFFGEGTLLFIKPESWEEIRDGDLVIFKDKEHRRAFVKKIEFADKSLILKPMNSLYKNMVLGRSDLMLLERVMALVF